MDTFPYSGLLGKILVELGKHCPVCSPKHDCDGCRMEKFHLLLYWLVSQFDKIEEENESKKHEESI